MTPRVWVERPIETIEDLGGLPVGTIAIVEDAPEAWRCGCMDYRTDPPTYGEWHMADGSEYDPTRLLTGTALVPVEAGEETIKLFPIFGGGAHAALHESRPRSSRRLCTPWEET